MSEPDFIPGLELSERFYREAVRPVLAAEFPGLRHSAALLGGGSEVLGFDTPMSTDHDWGPRVLLFLEADDHARLRDALDAALSRKLPHAFRGYLRGVGRSRHRPTRFGAPAHHPVEIGTPRGFFLDHLDFDIGDEIAPADWLTFGDQRLLEVTSGAVFHDEIGLRAIRERFAYYPHDVWLTLLASGWTRVGQEEHLMGRAGSVGDEIGSALIGARLVRDLMRLCFLMERRYAPYPKWFGTAFGKLACAADLLPILRGAQIAPTWPEREGHLCAAYTRVAALHNALGITEPLSTETFSFFGRPFRVIGGGRFADAIRARISDPAVRPVADRRLIGSIDQFSDSTDLVSHTIWRRTLRRLYE